MDNQQNDEIEINLIEVFNVLRARLISIIMTGIIFAAIAGIAVMFMVEPQYASTFKLYIVNQSSALTSLTDLQAGTQLTKDYMVMVESRPVLERVIENLDLDMEYEQLRSIMTLNNVENTRILEITVTTNDPYMAKEIVDEIGEVSRSRIATLMNVESPTVVEYGHLESSPCSPNVKKTILLGGVAGVFLSAAIFVVMYLLNDTIQTEEDVEKYLGLNNLGLIPIEEGAMEQMLRDKRKRKGKGKSFISRMFQQKKKK